MCVRASVLELLSPLTRLEMDATSTGLGILEQMVHHQTGEALFFFAPPTEETT